MPVDYGPRGGLADAQLAEHLDLYGGYVKQVNALVQELGRALIETYGSVDQWQQNFQTIVGMAGIG